MRSPDILGEPAREDGQDAAEPPAVTEPATPPAETGGREGPDPVRYGDWEKNGRCIDF